MSTQDSSLPIPVDKTGQALATPEQVAAMNEAFEQWAENEARYDAGRIKIKGRDGLFEMPDGSTYETIRCVIMAEQRANVMWPKDGDKICGGKPACRANDAKVGTPHDDLLNPKTGGYTLYGKPIGGPCEECPWNEWGSDLKGGKGKACNNKVVMMVWPLGEQGSMEPYLIDVPPTSVSQRHDQSHAMTDLTAFAKRTAHTLPIGCVVDLWLDPRGSGNTAYSILRARGKGSWQDMPELLPMDVVVQLREIVKERRSELGAHADHDKAKVEQEAPPQEAEVVDDDSEDLPF